MTPAGATTTQTVDCQLSFHQRVHAKAAAKTVTVGEEADPGKHLLMPLGGTTAQQELYQELVLALKEHQATVPVASTLSEPDFRAAARDYVRTKLPGFDVLDVAGIPSKWNPQSRTWDPQSGAVTAYAYVIIDQAAGDPVETYYTAGLQTLWIDFVIHLQRNAP